MAKVTITASDFTEGKVVILTTDLDGEETEHTLTAEEPMIEVELDEVSVVGIAELDADEADEGDDEAEAGE